MRAAFLAVALVMGLITFAAIQPALADEPSGVTLKPIPPPDAGPGQESIVLSAQLLSGSGEPIAGVPITFYVVTTVFGERLMKVGENLSDATGTASVLYQPRWEGDHTVVARFAGTADYSATQESFDVNAKEAASGFEPPEFGLEPVRQWLPVAVGVAILAVWVSLGYALATAVIGIPAAGASVPATQPLPPWDPQVRRPAPLGRALVGMALLLALAALPAAWLMGNARTPDDASLSTPDVHFEHPGTGGDGESVETQPDTLPAPEALPTTLVLSVQTTTFDETGQPAPGSVAMPADVAITAGHVRVLDANRGRIVTVTPDGRLASIFEGASYGDISLKGAPAMAAFDEKLYVATQDGRVVVIDSSGGVEGVLRPVAPAGQDVLTPGGIAVTDTGEVWMSDSANHRVLLLNVAGEYQLVIGEGVPSGAPEGLDTPGGITIDEDGNLYVADSGNGVIKKFSPMGVPLQVIGEGRLGQPSAVAVGPDGTIFASDEATHLVSAFAPDGTYLGSIGEGRLQTPHSVKTDGGMLYVMDSLAGLFIFQPEQTSGR